MGPCEVVKKTGPNVYAVRHLRDATEEHYHVERICLFDASRLNAVVPVDRDHLPEDAEIRNHEVAKDRHVSFEMRESEDQDFAWRPAEAVAERLSVQEYAARHELDFAFLREPTLPLSEE
ncbi:MAG: hypothetical protein QG597_4640 [Actinomycetota bacterium]|nr:hypothetical protein [Actinomycetota bacterium]